MFLTPVLQTPVGCPTINLVPTLCTYRQHPIPEVKCLVLQDSCPPIHFTRQWQVQGVIWLLTNWLSIRGSYDPLLGSIYLLEWLTELRETFGNVNLLFSNAFLGSRIFDHSGSI